MYLCPKLVIYLGQGIRPYVICITVEYDFPHGDPHRNDMNERTQQGSGPIVMYGYLHRLFVAFANPFSELGKAL